MQGGISVGRAARAKDRAVDAMDIADERGVGAEALWAAMRRAAAAVTVVTAIDAEGYTGITVSATKPIVRNSCPMPRRPVH